MGVLFLSNRRASVLNFMSGKYGYPCQPRGVLMFLGHRWLKSPAFGTWVAQQEQIVQDVLNTDEPFSTSVA